MRDFATDKDQLNLQVGNQTIKVQVGWRCTTMALLSGI